MGKINMDHTTPPCHRVLDALYSQPPESAAQGAFEIINVLQQLGSPARQVIALACVWRTVCGVLGLDPLVALRVVERMERDCRYRQVNTLSAVRRYVEHELLPHFP